MAPHLTLVIGLFLSALTLGAADAGAAGSWPHFRGLNYENAADAEAGRLEHLKDGLRVLWSRPFQDDKSLDKGPDYGRYNTYSGPAVVDGKIFLCRRADGADEIACLNAITGEDVWRQQIPSETVKKNFGGGIRCVPCVYGDSVYVVTYWNLLVCLNKADGAVLWKKDLLAEYGGKLPDFGTSASPVVLDGKLIVHPCGAGSAIFALDPKSGKEIWKAGNAEAAYGTPQLVTLHGVPQILSFLAPGLLSFDAATGRELWKFGYYEDWLKNTCFPLVSGNTIYVGNNTLGVTAIEIAKNGEQWNSKVLWASQREKWHFASAVLGEGCIFYNDGKGAVKSLDTATGKVNWAVHDMGRTWSQVLRLGGQHLLTASDNGQLAIIEATPREFRYITRYQFLGLAFVQPAVVDGRIYAQDFHKIYCLALTPELAQSGAGEVLKPLPQVPPDHSFGNYYARNWRTFRVAWFAAGALALMGVSLGYARRVSVAPALILLAALGLGTAAYIAATATGAEAKKYSAQRFGTLFTLCFAVGGAITCSVAYWVAKRRDNVLIEWVLRGLIILGATLGLWILSRSNLALVDIPSILTSAAIRDRTVAFGDIQGALGAAFAAMLLYFSQKHFVLGVSVVSTWRTLVLFLASGVVLAYTVRHLGAAFSLSCAVFPAWAALRLKGLRPWHAYWIAPLLAILCATIGLYLAFRFNATPGWWSSCAVVIGSTFFAGASLLLQKIWPFRRVNFEQMQPTKWAVRWTVISLFILGVLLLDNSIDLRAKLKDLSPHNIARYCPEFVAGCEAEWPMFRGPYQNGVVPAGQWPEEFSRASDEKGVDKGILWKTEVPGKGRSSPIVWGSRVFLTSSSETEVLVQCFDADNGALLWTTPVAALDPTEKLPLSGWAAPTGVSDGKHFVALFSTGDIAALDFSGKIVWKKNLGKLRNMYGYGSSLGIWKDRAIVQLDIDETPTQKCALIAIHIASGDVMWSRERKEGASWGTPVVVKLNGRDQIITCAAPNVVAYNPDDGAELWRAAVLAGDVVPSAVVSRGRVVVCNDQAVIAAIDSDGTGDVTKTKVVWKKEGADFPDTASPIATGDLVFLFCSNSKISAWNSSTGEKVWERELDNGFTASPLLVGKQIYAFNSNGVLFRLEAGESYDENGQYELNENVSATPAFSRGRIFVRGERKLYCIGKKGRN